MAAEISQSYTPEQDPEYEYEYDENETETFYVNLDLTACNGPIKPPRKRAAGRTSPPRSQQNESRVASRGSSPIGDEDDGNSEEDDDDSDNGGDDDEDDDDDETATGNVEEEPAGQIQIMDLHSPNPIVSYQNQIFTCSWADTIGTELIFSHPTGELDDENEDGRQSLPALRRTKDFDLISANRVKILGRKATLMTSSGRKALFREEVVPAALSPASPASTTTPPLQDTSESGGAAASAALSGVPPLRGNGPNTNQAKFLDRMMRIKETKGEDDVVRTVFPLKRSVNFEERLRGWARTEEQIAEFRMLNQRALEGDVHALMALEDLYVRLEGESRSQPGIPVDPSIMDVDTDSHTPWVEDQLDPSTNAH